MKPTKSLDPNTHQDANGEIDMLALSRTVLKVVAYLDEQQYTDSNERQVDVRNHDDLPNPANEDDSSQG